MLILTADLNRRGEGNRILETEASGVSGSVGVVFAGAGDARLLANDQAQGRMDTQGQNPYH